MQNTTTDTMTAAEAYRAEKNRDRSGLTARQARRVAAPNTRKDRKATERIHLESKMRLKPSAPELFAFLRPMMLASRPIITPAVYEEHPRRGLDGRVRRYRVQVIPAVYGKPTFRNAIVNGEHV